MNIAAAVGSSLEFYSITSVPNGRTTISSGADLGGKWSFNLLTDTLTWSPNTVSAVPVPPAVWLFLSGLIGVALTARRRSSAAPSFGALA